MSLPPADARIDPPRQSWRRPSTRGQPRWSRRRGRASLQDPAAPEVRAAHAEYPLQSFPSDLARRRCHRQRSKARGQQRI